MKTPFPVPDQWWTQLYDDLLAEILLVRQRPHRTMLTLDFLAHVLGLSPAARVFDQCCGIGSLAIPLAQRGYELIGVDLMEDYIRRARADADAARVDIDLQIADAAHFVPQTTVAGAFNWATSFGYFGTDEGNLGMIRSAFSALERGGRYALDFMNVPQVEAEFQPLVKTRRDTAYGHVELVRESVFGPLRRWLYKTWTYHLPDGSARTHRSRVRLYRPDDITRLMTLAGFVDVVAFGDVDGQQRTDASPRCITVGRRP